MTPSWGEEIISTKPRWKRVYFSFVWFVYVAMCSPGHPQYIFHTIMARYCFFVLKLPLNTNKTNKQYFKMHFLNFFSSKIVSIVVFWHSAKCVGNGKWTGNDCRNGDGDGELQGISWGWGEMLRLQVELGTIYVVCSGEGDKMLYPCHSLIILRAS